MVVQASSGCQVCHSLSLLLLLLLCCSSDQQPLTMEVFCFCLQLVCCLAACCLCVGNCRTSRERGGTIQVEHHPIEVACHPLHRTQRRNSPFFTVSTPTPARRACTQSTHGVRAWLGGPDAAAEVDGATHCVDGTLILQRGTGGLLLPDDYRVPVLPTIHVHCGERELGRMRHGSRKAERHRSRAQKQGGKEESSKRWGGRCCMQLSMPARCAP